MKPSPHKVAHAPRGPSYGRDENYAPNRGMADVYDTDRLITDMGGFKSAHVRTGKVKLHDSPQASSESSFFKAKTTGTETYQVWFKVYYKTVPGEEICVVGNTPELGQWKEHKYMLKWTEGHIWVSEKPLITNASSFFYKYRVLGEDGVPSHWETGVDRICVPQTLKQGIHDESKTFKDHTQNLKAGTVNVNVEDKFEELKIRFTLFDPLYQAGDKMEIEFSQEGEGLPLVLANQKPYGPIQMTRVNMQNQHWIASKYGQPVPAVFQGEMSIANTLGNSTGQFQPGANTRLFYSYIKHKSSSGASVIERQPARLLLQDDPNQFHGEITATRPHYGCVDTVQAVNGVIEKADGTFLEGFFFNEIGEANKSWNIILGSYPLYQVDIQRMKQDGRVTAVLSLQSDYEIAQRGIDEQQVKEWFRQGSIEYMRHPVNDLDTPETYADDIFAAAKKLDLLLSKKHRVYVHCTAGQSRNVTTVIGYLCLFIKSKHWQYPDKVHQGVAELHKGATPNIRAVKLMLKRHADFQKMILDRINSARTLSEAEKARLERIRQQQEQLLWQRREDYLRNERRQRQLLEQKRRQKEEMERQRLLHLENQRVMEIEEQIRQLNYEEEEEIRALKSYVPPQAHHEHFFVGDLDIAQINEDNLLHLQQQLFGSNPIPFVPRKDSVLEHNLKLLVDEARIGLPIIWIRDSLYLIGDQKIHLKQDTQYIIANVGGGFQEFGPWFVDKRYFLERGLITKMIQSRESLESVCQMLIESKQIKHHSLTTGEYSPTRIGSPTRKQAKKQHGNSIGIEKRSVQAPQAFFRSPTRGSPLRRPGTSPSPVRRSTKSPVSGRRKSAISNVSPNSKSPRLSNVNKSPTSPYNKAYEANIQKIREKYDVKRGGPQRELDYSLRERDEHVKQGDQTIVEKNRGKYSYVHGKA